MPEPKDIWEALYRRFDPDEPAHTGQWRADRRWSPIPSISAGLKRPFGEKRYLVMGTVGTGKTTELLRVAEERSEDHVVVFLDLWRHFEEGVGDPNALQHVQTWEVLLLIGLAVYRAAEARFGHVWSKEDLKDLERAAARFTDRPGDTSGGGSVDLARLASSLLVFAGGPVGVLAGSAAEAGVKAIGEVARASRWDFKIGVSGRKSLPDQDERVQEMLGAVNALIGTIQHQYRRLLLLVDGLDRIKVAETTRSLFVESTVLGSLSCATVLTAPLVLRRKGLAAQVRRFEPKVLANAPVIDRHDPHREGDGIEFLLDVFRRRVEDLPAPAGLGRAADCITEPHLRHLAWCSGGRARDFVRFIRMVAERAWDHGAAIAPPEIVNDAIDERRNVMEMGLNKRHIELLIEVMQDPERLLPDDEAIEALLEQWCLLPYPNGSEWYFPHPLLTLRRVPLPPRKAGSTA